jgi:mono/diheme cytochrome c family protein
LTRIKHDGVDLNHGAAAVWSAWSGEVSKLVAERDIMRDHRMKTSSWLWAVPLALLTASAGGARAADVASGGTLARQLCVNCHVVAPGEAGTQVTAGIPSFKAVANKPGQTPQKIQDFTINPHPPMPKVQLTNNERANLAAYILSLKD